MKILVANNHLVGTGGTENFTYALIKELVSRGHKVEYYCAGSHDGKMAQKIESELGVRFRRALFYDLVLVNHTSMVARLQGAGTLIQTCHGVFPALEQPARGADAYVAISREVQLHIEQLGLTSHLILNGIDCNLFYPAKPIASQLSSVLSLCQGDEANSFVEQACERLGVKMLEASKFKHNVFNIEELINQADMVVGVGRSLYDAMACGRATLSLDSRDYSTRIDGCTVVGDGYLNQDNIERSIEYNCTGRGTGRGFSSVDELEAELRRYRAADGDFMREYALANLNMARNVDCYLAIAQDIKNGMSRGSKIRFSIKRVKMLLSLLVRFFFTLENQNIGGKRYKILQLFGIMLYKREKR